MPPPERPPTPKPGQRSRTLDSSPDIGKPPKLGTQAAAKSKEYVMNLRQQLKLELERRGWTATRLARTAGIPKQSLSGWMAGNRPRNLDQLKKVADVLDLDLEELLFGAGDPDSPPRTPIVPAGAHPVRAEVEQALELLRGLRVGRDGWLEGTLEIRIKVRTDQGRKE